MAGTIDELNFKVMLDDAEFDAKVKNDIKLAKELNIALSSLLDIQKKVGRFTQEDVNNNRKANQILKDNKKAQEAINREHEKTLALKNKLNAQVERVNKGYLSQHRILNDLKNVALGYLSVSGASKLLSSLVRVTGEFELQKTTLSAMLGDLNAAESIITRIQGLAVESPFQFKELTTYAKQLSAFSVPAEELYDTTKMLADVSAGLGVGMDRIVLAYGQVRSAAFLRGQEVRQFTEAGIPILNELAKQFSELEGEAVSTGEVFDRISARLVPFEMVAKVFKDMTSEGGKFYKMQEIQAETLRGKISNLKDAYEVMLNEIGKNQSENLKGAVDQIKNMMQNYEEVGRNIVELVAAYGVYRATLAATAVVQNGFARSLVAVKNGVISLITKLASNPYAVLAAGVTTLGYALYKAATEQTRYEKVLATTNNTVRDFNRNMDEEKGKLKYLLDRLSKLTVGTAEYNEVKGQIMKEYGSYLSEVNKEKIAIGDLAGVYESLTESIRESNKQKALEEGSAKLTSHYTAAYAEIFKRFNQTIDALGIEGKGVRQALADFVRGEIGLDELPEEAKKAIKEAQDKINAAAYTRGGMFGNGLQFMGFDFEVLRKDLKEAEEEVEKARERLATGLNAIYGNTPKKDGLIAQAEGWRKIVQDTLSGLGLDKGTSFGLWAEDTTKSTDYVEDMIKRYKELKEEIKWVSTFDDKQAQRLKKNKEAIEAVAKALKIDIANLSANKSDTTESKEEKRIKRLIDALRTLQDQYEKLKAAGASDESIKTLFKSQYPELMKETSEEFVTSLDYLNEAKKLVDDLAQLSPESAKKILVDLGEDSISTYIKELNKQNKAYEETSKAANKYLEIVRKWATEDLSLDGEGLAVDIGKIATDLNTKINEIELRATKARELFGQIDLDSETEIAKVKEIFTKEFGEEAWNDFWKAFHDEGLDKIKDLTDKQIAYEKTLAQRKVDNLAQRYIKDATSGLDLKDWGDKSIGQVKRIRDEFNKIRFSEINLPDSLKKSITDAGLSLEEFSEQIANAFSSTAQEIDEEMGKKVIALGQVVAEQISEIGKALGELGEASGNEGITEIANAISEIGESFSAIIDGLKSGGVIGGIVAGIGTLATKIIEAVTAQQRLANAIAETAQQQRILNAEYEIMKGTSGSFGEDTFKQFTNAYEKVTEAYKDVQEDVANANKKLWGGTGNDSGDWGKIGGIAGGAAIGAAIGSIFPVIGTAIGAGVGALVGMIVGGVTDIALDADNYVKSLKQMADEIGAPLMNDETGGYNLETLKAIKDTYEDLGKEESDWLDRVIANAEIYEKAITTMAEYMSSVFGNVADDMADAFINAFEESGQAALEYGDIMDGLASDIAKGIIKATLLQNVFDEELTKNAAKELASGNAAGAMALVVKAMESAQELAPYIQEFLESMEPYFNMGGEDAGSGLGEGIKGITEDQANLLASYLNAIRADVAFSKTLWAKMDKNLQRIADMLTAPTLMEYQAQIAANTFDTAQATQAILAELRSVVTTDSGDSAIRVYS